MRETLWDIPTMTSATVDSKRRLVMPKECPPKSAVTIQQVDSETWIVKRQRPMKDVKVVLIPIIKRLPDDPEWDRVEAAFASSTYKKLPPPEE
jgi:hypothetical protein